MLLKARLSLLACAIALASAPAFASSLFEFRIHVPGLTASTQTFQIVQAGQSRNWSDGSYAASCAAYHSGDSIHLYQGATGDGNYTIQPSGASATNVYCDMSNGGWTLVAFATSGVSVSNWYNATGSYNVPSVPTNTSGSTWKYADTFINAISKQVYRFNSLVGYTGTFYADGRCVYGHLTAAANYCASTYSDAALTTLLKTGNGTGNGISDNNGSGYHIMTNNTAGYSTYGWCTGNGSSGQGGCGNAGTASTFSMWVK
jgi:hypothetical protein